MSYMRMQSGMANISPYRMLLQLITQCERNANVEQAIAPGIQTTVSMSDELMDRFVSKK